jgi:hypothetical protein
MSAGVRRGGARGVDGSGLSRAFCAFCASFAAPRAGALRTGSSAEARGERSEESEGRPGDHSGTAVSGEDSRLSALSSLPSPPPLRCRHLGRGQERPFLRFLRFLRGPPGPRHYVGSHTGRVTRKMRKKRRKGVGAPSLLCWGRVVTADGRPPAELPSPFCASFASFAAPDACATWSGLGRSQGQARDRDDGWSQGGSMQTARRGRSSATRRGRR